MPTPESQPEPQPEPQPISTFAHRPGDPWNASVELPVGAVLRIELHPAGGYRWSDIESSDSDVLGLDGAVDTGGVARFTVTASRPGQAVLTATTQFQGDRFGPPTRRWAMTARVVEPGRHCS